MNRALWTVAEQAVDLRLLMDGDAPHVALLRMRVDDADSGVVHLDVVMEDQSGLDIAFGRNGMATSHTVISAPQLAPEAEPER